MKILHIIQKAQLRGAEVFASQLATHLVNAGHEVVLVCLFAGNAELPFSGKIYHLDANVSRRFTDIKAWRELRDIINIESPDIIQANAGDTLKYSVLSKLFFRWKQPLVFRNASIISLYIKSRSVKLLNAFFFRYIDSIISVSITSALDIANMFPHYNKSIVTIPVGIEKASVVTPAHIQSKHPYLLHIGGFTFEKNHTGLISIFKAVLQTYPTATLHLVGDGPLRKQTEELVQQKGLQQQVIFHGFHKHPMEFLMQADAFLLPSLIEGLPGVVLEAFFCKTPVIAYDTGGVSELVYGRTGKLVNKNDEQSFSKAVIETLANPEQNEEIVCNAYSLVTTKYMNADIAQKFIKVYKAVITKQQSPIKIHITPSNESSSTISN